MVTLERKWVQFVNITINVPDQVGEAISQLPNCDELATQALKDMLEKYGQSLGKASTANNANKWQEMLHQIEKNRPYLSGVSDTILKDSKEFRENFVFNDDK